MRNSRIVKLDHAERLTNSVNGNPRYRVTFNDGTSTLTQSDASCNYDVANLVRSHEWITVEYSRAGRISAMYRMGAISDEAVARLNAAICSCGTMDCPNRNIGTLHN